MRGMIAAAFVVLGLFGAEVRAQTYFKLTAGFAANVDSFGGDNTTGGWVGPFEFDEPFFPPSFVTAQFELFFDVAQPPLAQDFTTSVHQVAAGSLVLTQVVDDRMERVTIDMSDPGASSSIEFIAGQGFASAVFRMAYEGGLLTLTLEGLDIDPKELVPGQLPSSVYQYVASPRVQIATDEGVFVDSQVYQTNLGYRVGFVEFLPNGDTSPGCSVADVAPPFGVLNFNDVIEFLGVFGAGCP